MIKLFCLYFLCFLPLSLHAFTIKEWQNATVKINSFPCLTERPRFTGSGILVSFNGNLWVITSEHIVIHDQNNGTCHEAMTSSSDGGAESSVSLELLTSDYKMGLALLKVSISNQQKWNEIALDFKKLEKEIESQNSNEIFNNQAIALGFPASSTQLQTLQGGSVISKNSQRALIPGVSSFIETSYLPIEYGMSGGVLLELINDKSVNESKPTGGQQVLPVSFLGLLSHQVLRRIPGGPTNPIDVKPELPSDQNDLAIAIPVTHVLNWFKRQFELNKELLWKRNSEAQKKGFTVIEYGPLLFSLKTVHGKDIWDVGGADGSGVGGGSNAESNKSFLFLFQESSNSEEMRVVDITLNSQYEQNRSTPLERTQFKMWRDWLLAKKKVRALFLKNPKERRLSKIQSIEQFFTYWWRNQFEPLVIRSNSKEDVKTDSEILHRRSLDVAMAAQSCRNLVGEIDIDLQSWFGMIRDYAILAENGVATSQEIASLRSGSHDSFWRKFYDLNFDAAVDLETKIDNLIAHLRKMGL